MKSSKLTTANPSGVWFYFAVTMALLATIYLLTICPFVGAGDSGELIVTAYKWVTPHPPGYPIYTFFAHWFTLLPFSTMAWRLGLFSAVCQLIGAALMFFLVRRWLKKDWLAAGAVLFYGLSPLIWRFAAEAEVFALSNLFAVLLLWTFYLYQSTRQLKWAYWACVVLGLASCHHLTILLFAFPFFMFFLWTDWRVLLRPAVFIKCVAIFLACLLPYFFLFYLGQQRLLITWGDLTTWDGFFTHVLRREYGTFQLATGDKENSTLWPKLFYFWREMALQTAFVGLLLWLWGCFRLRQARKEASFARLMTGALLFYVLVFQYLANLDLSVALYRYAQSRMWMLPLLLLIMGIAWAINDLHESLKLKHKTALIATVWALVLAVSVGYHWREQDGSQRDFFARVGHSMIDGVEPNAVILMREDVYVNSIRYLQTVENVRPDVKMIPVDELWWPWAKALVEKNVPGFQVPGTVLRMQKENVQQFNLRELIEANMEHFPLYIAKLYPAEEQTLQTLVTGFPYGFTSRIKRAGRDDFTLDEFKRESKPFLDLKMPGWDEHSWASWETFVYMNYFDVKIPIAQVLARRSQGRSDWLLTSAEVLKQVISESPDYRSGALDTLGTVYLLLAALDERYKAEAIKSWKEFLAVNPQENQETVRVREMLKEFASPN